MSGSERPEVRIPKLRSTKPSIVCNIKRSSVKSRQDEQVLDGGGHARFWLMAKHRNKEMVAEAMRIESVTSMPCHRFDKGAGNPGRETYTTGLGVRNAAHSATSLTQASSTYCLVGRSRSPRGTADGAATRPMY